VNSATDWLNSHRSSLIASMKQPMRIDKRLPWFSQLVRFLQISRLLLWTIWVIYGERRRVIQAHARGDYTVRHDSYRLIQVLIAFREAALRFGVLMIKLGQFLSSRVDLLPERAIAVLSSLQDEVPPAPFD